jgi:hypothetical protein
VNIVRLAEVVRFRSLVLLLVAASACGQRAGPSGQDSSGGHGSVQKTVRQAAATTLAATSFKVVWRDLDAPPHVQPAEWAEIYVAPDRLHQRELSSRGDEIIHIGKTVYLSDPQRAGFYNRLKGAPEGTSRLFFPYLVAVLEAEGVTARGSAFTFSSPLGRGKAEVSGGRIVALTIEERLPEGILVTAYDFAKFNQAPPVSPPPEDRVVPSEGLPPCGEQPTPTDDFPVVVCDPKD